MSNLGDTVISNTLRTIQERVLTWKSRQKLVMSKANDTIDKSCSDDEIKSTFSRQRIDALVKDLRQEATKFSTSKNPFLANRKKLATTVDEFSQYQVLVMDPPPLPDTTGLRGKEITGFLQCNIQKLSPKKNYRHIWEPDRENSNPDHDQMLQTLKSRHLISRAKAELFQSLNAILDESHSANPGWYETFLVSMCAHNEHYLRLELGMDSVLNRDASRAKVIASEYRIFCNLVKNGVENPHEAWEEIVSHIESEHENDQLATYQLYLSQYPH